MTAEDAQRKLEKLQTVKPVDVERNALKQELLTLASKRINIVRAYLVCTGSPSPIACT